MIMEREQVVREIRKRLSEVDELLVHFGEPEPASTERKLYIESFEKLLEFFPDFSKSESWDIYTRDVEVVEFLSSFSSVRAMLSEASDDCESVLDIDVGGVDLSSFGKFDFDFGSRVREGFSDSFLIGADPACCQWGKENWNALFSEVNAEFVVFSGSYKSAFCYDGLLTRRQVFSILKKLDFFVGEDGWVLKAASLLGCSGLGLLKNLGGTKLTEFGVETPINVVIHLIRQVCSEIEDA